MRKINFDPMPGDADQAVQSNPTPVKAMRPLIGIEGLGRPAAAVGALSQSLGNIRDKAIRVNELEQQLLQGQVVLELDPELVDPSFVRDRMEASDEQNVAFRDMIKEHGQSVPILVRPSPKEQGRYEVAFGHRRLRAAHDLGIKVRAVVRELSNEELVVAQGQENSGRTDLTYIERARFAAKLEAEGFSREIIMASLNIDRPGLSRLITTANRIPATIIDAIGPGPGIGRLRWAEFINLLDEDGNRQKAELFVRDAAFSKLASDKRFDAICTRLRIKATPKTEIWRAQDGTNGARLIRSDKKLIMKFDDRAAPEFGEYVTSRLQALYDEYKNRKIQTSYA